MTLFLTTHYMEEADALCDRIAIIDNGRIKTVDTPENLKKQLGKEIVTLNFKHIDGEKREQINATLLEQPFILNTSMTETTCTAAVHDGDAAIPKILQSVQSQDLDISSVTLKKPSLDDVYLSFTGKHLRDGNGGGRKA
ncbi:MAG: DUF4162 domain-containing protein, partial [Candidatus Electrothrix sp. ATG2]|nr:DUF4162 domain-containing protein [Candidatus Electrothrix sp. ATG2]